MFDIDRAELKTSLASFLGTRRQWKPAPSSVEASPRLPLLG